MFTPVPTHHDHSKGNITKTSLSSIAVSILLVVETFHAAAGWTNLGPSYKVIKTVVVSPQDTSVVYAGAFGWGVFRSTNGGATWNPRQNGLTNTYVRSLAVISDSLVFAGTNDGVYKTTNAGSLWALSQATPFSVRALAYDPAGGTVYAGTYGNGIYRSTDLGASWSTVTITDPVTLETLTHVWSIGVYGADSLYAGGSILDISAGGALFRSTDAGSTWIQVQPVIGIRSSVRSIAISSNSPATGLIIGTANRGVYKSTNAGTNWTQINAETTPGPLPDLQINAVAFSQTHRFAGTDSLGGFYARDLGDTTLGWVAGGGLPGTAAVVSSIDVNDPNPDEVYLGTEGAGVYRSLNTGLTWSARNAGMLGTYARAVAVNGNGDILLGTNFGDGIWRSTDQGSTWTKAATLNTVNSITSFAITGNPSIVYAAAYGSGVYRSADGGTTWTLTDAASMNIFVRTLVADPGNVDVVYAGTGNGIYKTTNGGAGWSAVNTGIPASTAIRSATLDPSNVNTLYAGTDSLFLFKTTNGGSSWTNFTAANGFLPTDHDVRSVTVDYANSNVLYAGVDSGRVYRSSNGGSAWSLLAQLPATHSVRSVLIHPNDHRIYFAATFGDGIFVSVDSGIHWAAMNTGLSDSEISALVSDGGITPTLYAGSGSHGVYRTFYSFVNSPPVLSTIGDRSVFMNQQLLISVSATDADGTDAALTATGMPPGALFTDSLNGRGLFTWIPSPSDLGDHPVTFHASDGILADSETVVIHVLDPGSSSIVTVGVEFGWNLVSVPVGVPDFRKGTLFPTSTSQAYAYIGSYAVRDTLSNGPGYWLKYPTSTTIVFGGASLANETLAVRGGWNIIGSASQPIPVTSLLPVPPVAVISSTYGFSGVSGYIIADSVHPGSGYWIKVNQAGEIILGSGPASSPVSSGRVDAVPERRKAGSVHFRDTDGVTRSLTLYAGPAPEFDISGLPPLPPSGIIDVRVVATQGTFIFLEPGSRGRNIPIQVSSGGGIVGVTWEIDDPAFILRLDVIRGGRSTGHSLQGYGSAELDLDAGITIGRLAVESPGPSDASGQVTFLLDQNRPNPFNPSTGIGYDLPSAARVHLAVFDVLGRVVVELVDGVEGPGHHAVTWNAEGMSSGVYFYRLEASMEGGTSATQVLTKKMFLLR